MKSFVITMSGDRDSVGLSHKLNQSIEDTQSNVQLETFEAVIPLTLNQRSFDLFGKTVPWTWPTRDEEDGMDHSLGMWKKTYPSTDQNRVKSCAVSHFELWKKCAEENVPYLILEHDAIFVKKFDPDNYVHKKWGVMGLNDPRGNTRKGMRFNHLLEAQGKGIHDVPKIDFEGELPLPMGLAGNSAYMIKPHAAKKLLDKIEEIGMWPNDAIMCRQLFPGMIKVLYPYYTSTQRNVSSTTKS